MTSRTQAGPTATFYRAVPTGPARAGLLLVTCLAWVVTTAIIFATVHLPQGLFGLGTMPAVLAFGTMLSLHLMLCVIYAAILEHNRRITPAARTWWRIGFALAPPFTMPLYWWMHVQSYARESVSGIATEIPPA